MIALLDPESFLAFFEEREHTVVASSSLVPDDPTLLFTNAGMVQFKDVFLGIDTRPYRRAASAQRCLRVTGKHNDLETVGPSPRHHTFFEMLGNFSFGDYFKAEAIRFAWDLVIGLGVDADRIVPAVHAGDDDAFAIWRDDIGRPADSILRMGDATNLWMMAEVGPCGPTSELHYDFGAQHCTCHDPECSVALDNDCGRWLEIWNLVFMQFDQAADGTRRPLPQTGVDTGMGLERIASVLQGVDSNYDTDLFLPIMDGIQARLDHTTAQRLENIVAFRVLADHGRAMAFLVADGVLPGNEGRNYVLRLIMRRAMRFGRLIGMEGEFLAPLAQSVVGVMRGAYPQLAAKADWIAQVVTGEEERFQRTLEAGLARLDSVIDGLAAEGATTIPGAEVFRLYDTYGFPADLTRVVAEERGLGIDAPGFDEAMAAQRARARAGERFVAGEAAETYRRLDLPAVEFVGYDGLTGRGEVVALVVGGQSVGEVGRGTEAEVVLDRTPFYAEAGGQVGDTGALVAVGASGTVDVTDTYRPVPGVTVHRGRVREGALRVGDVVDAQVDGPRRWDIMRNHTATHLLHAALQRVLGTHAQQRGSLVAPDRLRFDFAHLQALTTDELRAVEAQVNAWIMADTPVSWGRMPLEEAKATGAMMLFGEKYGAEVRVVQVEGSSTELCGGTHLSATGQIGSFIVTAEGSVGSGLRRIEAVTGRGAEEYVRERLDLLHQVAHSLQVPGVEGVLRRLAELDGRLRDLEGEVAALRAAAVEVGAEDLAAMAQEVDGVRVVAAQVEAPSPEALRSQVDAVRRRMPSGIVVLGAVIDGRPRLVASVSDDLVSAGRDAGRLVKAVAAHVGGGGGGRPQLAEAGGRDPEKLDAALAAVPALVAEARG
ncbi:MAG: alanine--tRNA ligase [Anaerolineae bacterium]